YRNDRGGVDIVAGNFNDSAGDDLALVPWRGDSELRTYRFRTDFVPVLLDEVVTHGVETGGFQLSSGDYNGDGRPDVAIASRNRMTDVRVYRYSRGSEEWQLLGWLYPYPQGDSGSQMDSGDVNGDGMDDLVFVANTTTEQANLQAYTFDGSSTKDKSFRQTRGFRRIDGRWIDAVSDAFVGPFTLSVGNLFGQSRDEIVLGSSDGFIRVVGLQEGVFRVMDRYLPFPMWQSRVTPNILPTGHRSGERLFLTDNEDSLIQVLRWSEGNLVKLRSFYGFDEDASFGTVVGR
ncbi:MAG: VCBS repeat-containing protein, partial [Candidatus Kerfeldbacteria bacterium]|nr:VCBS repeat-containing protein [Candidatus Kerfeldbacteria bacterium]